MPRTRVPSEQLKFRSQNTGEHDLDLYLEDAELGGLELSVLLSKIFDASTGEVDAFTFRYLNDEQGQRIEYQVGTGSFRELQSYNQLFADIASAKADALQAIQDDRNRAETAAGNAESDADDAEDFRDEALGFRNQAEGFAREAGDFASQAFAVTPDEIRNNINIAVMNGDLFNGSALSA